MADDTPSVADLCARANAAIATSCQLKEETAALLDAAHAFVVVACARLGRTELTTLSARRKPS